jgi:hypothetical protein
MKPPHIISWMSPDQPTSLADDLARRDDDQLLDLLQSRPDLASPPPPGVEVLAQRAMSAASINRCGEDLDLLSVAVLEMIATLGSQPTQTRGLAPVSTAAIVDGLAGRAAPDAIRARIDALVALALVWGPPEALVTGPHLTAAWPWRSRLATAPLNSLSLAEVKRKPPGQVSGAPATPHSDPTRTGRFPGSSTRDCWWWSTTRPWNCRLWSAS